MAEELVLALTILRPLVLSRVEPNGPEANALATLKTFCAVALRVMAKTNPSKIASEARTVELSTLVPPTTPRSPT